MGKFCNFIIPIPIPTQFRPDPDPLVDLILMLNDKCLKAKLKSLVGEKSVNR